MDKVLQKVMCVDDEEDILAVAKFALENVGSFTVETCQGGKNAVAKALEFLPNIIMLDVMMPEMDGPATLRAIQSTPQLANTPVVFMTAKVQKSEIDGYLVLGVCGVIPKPFDPMTLSDEVTKIYQGYQETRQSA
jgi:CheY-like chemotaxis protein